MIGIKDRYLGGIILFFAFHTSLGLADIKEYRYQHLIQEQLPMLSILSELDDPKAYKNFTTESTFNQKLDPSNPSDTRTFKQRYFINSYFAGDTKAPLNSPILFIMCGEGACDGGDFGGAVAEHARKLKARLVALEHRYYGKSQPFDQLTAENLKYLKTEYALADLARFQDAITAQNSWTGAWIAIGGSYSGSLAAYYRLKHPEKVVGALASSAPVQAKAKFEEYDADVTETAGPDCANAIRKVIQQVQDTFSDPAQLTKMKHLFGGDEIHDNIDFIYTLADMAAIAIQYAKKDEFCSAVLGPDALAGYAKAGRSMFDWFGITALQDSFQGAETTDASEYTEGVGMRQWLWQSCTEYGYFQVAHSDPARSVRSPLITLDFHYQMCEHLFGLKHPVNPEQTNQTFYWPLLDSALSPRASRIFFTNGATDPWQYLSITQERGNNTNPLFNYLTINGGSHCSDLGTLNNPAVTQAQQRFEELGQQWLSGN